MIFLVLIIPVIVMLLAFLFGAWLLIKSAVKKGVIEAYAEIEAQKNKKKKPDQIGTSAPNAEDETKQ